MKLFTMYDCYPASRLLLGSGLLFMAIFTQSMGISLVLLILSVVIIRMLDGHTLTIIRLLRLLRWFVVPIIVLHALFTPGQLLWPDFFIAISREGLLHGGILSLHLGTMFFIAMLMFRLLKRFEWIRYMLAIPYIGKRLAMYVWMLSCMKMGNMALLGDLRLQFKLRKDIKKMPLLLMAAFRQSLADATEHASALWLRWPDQMLCHTHPSNQQRTAVLPASLLLAGIGLLAFLCPWII
ncbi:MAG: hypothetical protein Q9M17_01275 [Mariprofundus sp.]|nr:hypothetical protein [Mariprofundus sp.]